MADILNLCGLSCPLPLLKTRTALEQANAVTVVVDDIVAKENISKFAKHAGYQLTCTEQQGEYTLAIRKA